MVTSNHLDNSPYVVPYQAAHGVNHHVNPVVHGVYNDPHYDYAYNGNVHYPAVQYPVAKQLDHHDVYVDKHPVKKTILGKLVDHKLDYKHNDYYGRGHGYHHDDRLFPLAAKAKNAVGKVADVGYGVVAETYDYVGDVASYAWQRRPRNILNAQGPQSMGSESKDKGLSTGAIIGIAGGGVVFLALCVGSLCYFMKGNNKAQP